MSIRWFLTDLDDTLLDYRQAERLSLLETLEIIGAEPDEGAVERFAAINCELWAKRARGEIDREQLRHDRFARLLPTVGIPVERTDEANRVYTGRLSVHGEMLPGAEELLKTLHRCMKIALVTNGVSDVQRERLRHTPLMQYVDAVIISEEVGLQKPDPAMIECALKALGCTDKRQAVMLGDSETTDIAAARAAGIGSILLSAENRKSAADRVVSSLPEVMELLNGIG